MEFLSFFRKGNTLMLVHSRKLPKLSIQHDNYRPNQRHMGFRYNKYRKTLEIYLFQLFYFYFDKERREKDFYCCFTGLNGCGAS